MKVKDLIKSLSQYDKELDIIFCDSSYNNLDDDEVNRDLMIGKDAIMRYGFYDKDIDGVIPVECTDSRVNCLELSIQDFQLDPYIQVRICTLYIICLDTIQLFGKIKSHDEYNGKKQTVLTRCKYEVLNSMKRDKIIAEIDEYYNNQNDSHTSKIDDAISNLMESWE